MKLRNRIAKELLPLGITGRAIDRVTWKLTKDFIDPYYALTSKDMKDLEFECNIDQDLIKINTKRRAWEFAVDGFCTGTTFVMFPNEDKNKPRQASLGSVFTLFKE